MKIYSWNVLYSNVHPERVMAFTQDLDFDVLALQEVPSWLLEKLSELPFHLAQSIDTIKTDSTGKEISMYLVVISRTPIRTSQSIPLPSEWYTKSTALRVRITGRMLSWHAPSKGKTALLAVLQNNQGEEIQVFCTHLTLMYATPALRLKEFDYMMQYVKKEIPLVVCGDLNTLELPHITLLNWLAGGTVSDWLFFKRERRMLMKRLQRYGLQNPLRGRITHPIAFSQIDHILIPSSCRVAQFKVLKDTRGSDHAPVMVEADL